MGEAKAVVERKVVIIGSGFGGQCAAINLQKKGIHDYAILERRSFMGGTWAQNTYPGAAVDVQSPLYSFSFEPYDWSQMFVEQDELKAYTMHVIEKYGLREKTFLNANVDSVTWLDAEKKWEIKTSNGIFRGNFIINASGPLSTPVTPKFPGAEKFTGKSFHTNNWDHAYDYKGKRVAVIGSGASAAQVIPAILGDVKELHIFQRTPHWVMSRPDHKFSAVERAMLRMKPFYYGLRNTIYWQLESRVIGLKYSDKLLKMVAQSQAEKLLEEQVENKVLRAKLTPDYTIGCKRVILSSTLLPAMAHAKSTVYGKDEGIAEINETGLKTKDGRQVDLDLIVYATGYDATDGVISYPVTGLNGKRLADFWREFPRAYLGTTVPGFPNLFIVTGPNTGIGHTSAIFIIESQMHYIMQAIENVDKARKAYIDVKADAEEKYTENIHREMAGTVWQSGGCNSWYKSKSGKVIAMYPGFSFVYENLAKNFKAADHVIA